ncbi:MAG: hypothetical protein V7641_4434 [Blastocatellia bacterium]
MNLEEFANRAVILDKIDYSNINMDEAAQLVVRWGFPTPGPGMMLFANHRGDENNGVDWAAERLREYIVNLIENVVNDAIGAIQSSENLNDNERKKAIDALRVHFNLVAH